MPSSDSEVYTVLTDSMVGVVILDPDDPSESAKSYIYGQIGRTEDIAMGVVEQMYVTERRPEYSFSGSAVITLQLLITIPWDEDHDAQVDSLRNFIRQKKSLVYRDNRSRFLYGVLTNVSIVDSRVGTEVSADLTVTEFYQ